jgi:hypothetical protein
MNVGAYTMNHFHNFMNQHDYMMNIDTYCMNHRMIFNNSFPIYQNIVLVL